MDYFCCITPIFLFFVNIHFYFLYNILIISMFVISETYNELRYLSESFGIVFSIGSLKKERRNIKYNIIPFRPNVPVIQACDYCTEKRKHLIRPICFYSHAAGIVMQLIWVNLPYELPYLSYIQTLKLRDQ